MYRKKRYTEEKKCMYCSLVTEESSLMDFKQRYFGLLQSTYRILNPFFSSSPSPAESPAPRGSLGPFRSSGSRQLCEHSYDEATVSRSIWTPNGCGGGIYAVLCRFLRARCTKVQLSLTFMLPRDVHASPRSTAWRSYVDISLVFKLQLAFFVRF